MNADDVLVVQNAVKVFTVRRRSLKRVSMTAVDDVSLTVRRGETVRASPRWDGRSCGCSIWTVAKSSLKARRFRD